METRRVAAALQALTLATPPAASIGRSSVDYRCASCVVDTQGRRCC